MFSSFYIINTSPTKQTLAINSHPTPPLITPTMLSFKTPPCPTWCTSGAYSLFEKLIVSYKLFSSIHIGDRLVPKSLKTQFKRDYLLVYKTWPSKLIASLEAHKVTNININVILEQHRPARHMYQPYSKYRIYHIISIKIFNYKTTTSN